MTAPRVLIGCERSGVMRRAFLATGFELIGLPVLKPTLRLTPPAPGTDEHKAWSRVHRMPPGPERARLRSETFPGLAAACAEQWGATMGMPEQMELFAA